MFLGSSLRNLGPVTVRDRAWLIERLVTEKYLHAEAKILWDKRKGSFHLSVALRVRRPADPDPTHERKRVVVMDPGERRFQTYYDPSDGSHGVLLEHYYRIDHQDRVLEARTVSEELHRRCRRIDTLQSRVNRKATWREMRRRGPPGRAPRQWRAACDRLEMPRRELRRRLDRRVHRARRHARRRLRREQARLHDFKHEMHYASIGFVWRYWDVAVVSTASFGTMCQRDKRPFGSRVARRALSWAHYAWRERLKSGAFTRAGRYVVETSEEYTTQTCGLCGTRNPAVGASEVFRCINPACGVHLDRDVNGARNIGLLKLTRNRQQAGRG